MGVFLLPQPAATMRFLSSHRAVPLQASNCCHSACSMQLVSMHPSLACLQHSSREHAELEGKLVAAVLAGREGDWAGMAQQMGEAQHVREGL